MNFPTYDYETKKIEQGFVLIAGCDEVGRGPLAGPVVAAAVMFDPKSLGTDKWWGRIRDSKAVLEKERLILAQVIKDRALCFAIAEVTAAEIDEINIHAAGLLAMKKSVDGLIKQPDFIFLDGRHKIDNLSVKQEAVIKGDSKILSVAAASIVAKVARDLMMDEWHEKYPQYGFAKHKGYPTKEHREAIGKYGVLPIHRKSFSLL
jgi:ribonuclease HII